MVVTHQVWALFFNGCRAPSPAFLKNGLRTLTLDIFKKSGFLTETLWQACYAEVFKDFLFVFIYMYLIMYIVFKINPFFFFFYKFDSFFVQY